MGWWHREHRGETTNLQPRKETVPEFGTWDCDEGYSIVFQKLHRQKTAAVGCAADSTPGAKPQTRTEEKVTEHYATKESSSECGGNWTRDAAYPGGKAQDPPQEEDKPKVASRPTKGAKMYHVPEMGWWDGMESGAGAPYLGSSIIFDAARSKRDKKGSESEGTSGASGSATWRKGRKGARRPARAVVNELGPFAAWTGEHKKQDVPADCEPCEVNDTGVTILSGRIPRTTSRIVVRIKWRFLFGRRRSAKSKSRNTGDPVPEAKSWGEGPALPPSLSSRSKATLAGNGSKQSSGSTSHTASDSTSGSSSPNNDRSTESSESASPASAAHSGAGDVGIPKAASGRSGSRCAGRLPLRETKSAYGKTRK